MKPDDTDETDLFEDAQRFIEEIRPAIERPLTPKELKNLTPYGRDYRKDLKCPLCHESMVNEEVYFHCPKSHGVLLSGGQLRQLISGTLKPKIKYNNPLEHPHVLLCPACKSEMSQVNYLEGEMVIDSCTKCAYRWLDAGEYTQ